MLCPCLLAQFDDFFDSGVSDTAIMSNIRPDYEIGSQDPVPQNFPLHHVDRLGDDVENGRYFHRRVHLCDIDCDHDIGAHFANDCHGHAIDDATVDEQPSIHFLRHKNAGMEILARTA